jgi:Dolichyl-phosphate-mannose-protein mannosyltransferase
MPRLPPTISASRIIVFVLLLVFAAVSGRWPSEHLLPWIVRLAGTLLVIAGAVWVGQTSWWPELSRRAQDRIGRSGLAWPIAFAVLATIISTALTYLVLEPFPHIEDEAAYYFQARIFASGHLFAPAPPSPEFFPSSWMMLRGGRWFSVFPPGWPLLLAIGMKGGVPALVNPVLTGLCVLVMYELIREMYDTERARWGVVLCVVSPFFLFMGGSFMSHTALLLFTALSTLCQVKGTRTNGLGWFLAAGLSTGCALVIRPLDAVAIWGGQTLYALWVGRLRHLKGLALSLAGLMLGAALYSAYNRVLVGEWFRAPLLMMNDAFRMGFGSDIGVNWETFDTPGHNPWRALINLNFNMAVMSQDLFGWPLSSLFFVIVFWVFGRMSAAHRLSAAITASVAVAYGLFWYHGVCFGARFYFCLLPHLVVFSIDGIRRLPHVLAGYVTRVREPLLASIVGASVLLSSAFGWLVYVPKVSLLGPYHNQRGINSGLYDFVKREGITSGIVFVQASRGYLFSTGFIANELPLGSGLLLFALDRGAANSRLIDRFPGRAVYRFSYEPEPNPYQASLDRLMAHAVE